jgi:hypothetical protein
LQDGNVAFQGYAQECAKYFGSIGVPCPTFSNPSDFYIKKLSVNYPKTQQEIESIEFFDSNYRKNLLSKIKTESESLVYTALNTSGFT